MTKEHKPLPVEGYRPQSDDKIAKVNAMKRAEEVVLRALDTLASKAVPGEVDGRWYAIGRTHIEQGFMAVNRAIFQPTRVALPGDE